MLSYAQDSFVIRYIMYMTESYCLLHTLYINYYLGHDTARVWSSSKTIVTRLVPQYLGSVVGKEELSVHFLSTCTAQALYSCMTLSCHNMYSELASPEALSFFKVLGRHLRARSGEPFSFSHLLQQIGVTIQQGNTAAVLGTAPGPWPGVEIWLYS